MTVIRKAIVPAAGLGTRFLPATKAIPKEMLPIVDVPTIQLVVEEAVQSGIEDIVLVTGRHKSAIEDHFDHAFELEHTLHDRRKRELLSVARGASTLARLISVRQKRPLGLGHAVLCARSIIGDEPFAVMLGDDLVDNDQEPGLWQLRRVYEETGAGVVMVMEVPEGREHLYGIVDGEPTGPGRFVIKDMVEKPAPGTAPSRMAVVGRYVLPPSIWPILEATQPGKGGEIQLTDALRELACSDPAGLMAVVVEGTRHDAGDKLGYLRANIAYALKRPEMRDAVHAMLREFIPRE